MNLRFTTRFSVLVAGLAAVGASWCEAQGQYNAPAPAYWSQRVFLIPYRDAGSAGPLQRAGEVQLLVSRDGTNDWRVLQTAGRNVSGFTFHAPEDGEYWFAVRDVDRRSTTLGSFVRPQVRVVVDTQKPQIVLRTENGAGGRPVVRYEATDTNLQSRTLVIEQRSAGGQWQRVLPAVADVDLPDRLIGRIALDGAGVGQAIELRATVVDAAGNRAHTEIVTTTGDSGAPSAEGLTLRGPLLPTVEWPAQGAVADNAAPPLVNPYAPAVASNDFTAPHLAPVTRGATPPTRFASESLKTAQPAFGATPRNEGPEKAAPSATVGLGDGWGAPRAPMDGAQRSVNTQTFDLDYELNSVGPWGVARVEVWGSPDGGQTWQRYAVDSDNRSPARVTVPGAGTYGFWLVVDGADGASARRPQPGDTPQMAVGVDLQPPLAQLVETRLGEGNLTGHLLLRWTATDTNLEARPVGLYFSSDPAGPWSTIATGLENVGHYTWRLARHVPDVFYVRLEVRDRAGNVTAVQSPTPVTINRPKPMGQFRGARPAGAVRGI